MLADQLGFDAIVVNEHHNTVYSMMATPNLIAAALVPQTKNARICVWGTPPNFMLPNRLAEEYAILDVMSKGRLEVALPLGTGMEYWAQPGQSGDRAREVQGVAQDHPAGVDRGRPDHALRQLLHLPLPQPVAAAVPAAASALLHRRHRQPGDHRDRGRARLRLCVGVRHPAARARAQRDPAPARRALRPHHAARPAAAADLRLRRRDAGAGGAGVHRRTCSASSRTTRAPRRNILAPPGYLSVDQLKMRAAHGRQDARRLRLQRRSASRSSSPSARPTRSPTRSASGRSG